MNKLMKVFGAVAVLCAAGVRVETVGAAGIEFVYIGNEGNAADASGYGAVSYGYRISKNEISYDQWQQSGIGGGDAWLGDLGSNAPVANITWHQAARYCNWLTSGDASVGAYTIDGGGKVSAITGRGGLAMDALVATHGMVYVLPTEDEWYKAAYYTGSGYSLFANGTATAPVAGVDSRYGGFSSPATVGFGTQEQNNTFDMMGNVWEWLESAAGGEAFNPLDDNQNMVVRGGAYFLSNDFYLQSGNRFGLALRGETNVGAGLRIAAIPEPGTISLMGLSTVSLFLTRTIRRRRRLGKTLVPVRRERRCDLFCSETEWLELSEAEDEESYFDFLSAAFAYVAAGCRQCRERLGAEYAELDKAFWDRMVVRHERRLARRAAFRQALKKRALAGFDAFLALIMK